MKYTEPALVYEGGTRNLSTLGARLVATSSLPIHTGYSLAILDVTDGPTATRSLNDRASTVGAMQRAHAVAEAHEEADLNYAVRAALYHLNRIIDEYVRMCRLFDEVHPRLRSPRPGSSTSNPVVSFEIDAVLTAARRVYEAVRRVVWKHYMPGRQGRWRSYSAMLNGLDDVVGLDAVCVAAMHDSWRDFGAELKSYRDCLSHAGALDNGHATCWMLQVDGRWRMTFKLPSNPDVKSHLKFDYEQGPDALTYCWELVSHLVGLCERVVAQDRIAGFVAADEPMEP